MIYSDAVQGTPEWLSARLGVLTGSRFKDCRDRTLDGELSAKARLYAQDTARVRLGGRAQDVYVNAAMRFGTEQEKPALNCYEIETGRLIESAGFICTDDRKFGVSVDGLVEEDGLVEVKAMVSSATLFRVLVERDISEYEDQIYGEMWLLSRKWCDLCIWSPDLTAKPLNIIRIWRDDNIIAKLESDLLSFEAVVSEYERLLKRVMTAPLVLEERTPVSAASRVMSKSAAPAQAPAPRVSEFERLLKRVTTARNQAEVDLLLDGIDHLPEDQRGALWLAANSRVTN